ncbi:MAG TPA: monofunctional biosynthetic peptidoglycan transglycosylase [Puia sp.]|uniref:monofunctional biosynthetic peptidoglycan transglycosylase n=1 Tax=Puia sp. TaxID=2045100 RepID=UPI002CEEEC0B|nr:monofunctional biosynthetic peptidoglycan transglycosylase [Puia sp.]HVU97240.1 monofunctional biosynthetic peptidoglycan transglycosylase [Puia sp.]
MAINTKGLIPRAWRIFKRVVLFLFIFHLFYLLLLKWVDPPITLTQLGSLFRGEGLKRTYVSMKDISPYAKLAVICSEDQLFPDHDGFDFKSIEKAMKHNQKSKSLHGASTISQQVAKNVFLWQGRSWFRKAMEAYFTFMIEWMWGKKRILELYLNISEMGKGVYGIEAAAHTDYNKSARNLTRIEAARIAASLPNPKVYTVKPLSSHVAGRSAWIVGQMGVLQNDPDIQKLLQ